jgi:hypothetical protein
VAVVSISDPALAYALTVRKRIGELFEVWSHRQPDLQPSLNPTHAHHPLSPESVGAGALKVLALLIAVIVAAAFIIAWWRL